MELRSDPADVDLGRVLTREYPYAVVVLVDDVHVHLEFAEVRFGLHHLGRVAGLTVALLLQAIHAARHLVDADARSEALQVGFLRVFR